MADPCVRSITFTIPSTSAGPATQVYVEELSGNLVFTVDLLDTAALTGDLRGLFFHMTEAALAGLSVVNADAAVTETRIARNSVIDLGNGANLHGAVKSGFDVGIEFGEAGIGIGKLDVNGPVSFTLDGTQNLTLDLLTHMQFGSRITSIGAPAGSRSGSSKDLVVAPAAPDAQADSYQIFEDGQSGLNDPSATPDGVLFAVLANDTDADGDTLTVTDVHGAAHGTLQIVDGPDADLLPGDAVLYTPDKDYAGGDSFEYCVSDGHGGTDFASVDVLVVAVADVPTLTYSVAPGAAVNQIVVSVTATQTDADSSEFIDRIALSGVPAGTLATPSGVNPGAEPDQIVQDFLLTLPTGQDVDFDLGITAVSREVSNGDEESKSATLPIKLEFAQNDYAPTFTATNQSIWDNGAAFTFTDDRFLGVDDGFSSSSGGLIGYNVSANVKAGLQSTLKFSAGDIDASLNYALGVDTSFNKTTDSLLIQSSSLLTGGDFVTQGPSGSYKLDFIFNYDFNVALTYDIGVDSGNIISASGSNNYTANILDLNSDDLALEIPFPPPFGSLSASLAWPNIATDANPTPPPTGEFSAGGASNNFLQLNLDVDQALADIFLGGVNPFDIGFDITVVWGNIELLDLDLSAGLNFLQSFVMQAQGITGVLNFENGAALPFTFGADILLQDASVIDAGGDGDGVVEFVLALDAQATLRNDTDLGFNVGYNFDVLKVSGGYDVGVDSGSFDFGPVYNTGGTQPIATVGVYDNTFNLNFASQDFGFGA